MIKLIIFDFDGVIIDSHAAYFACYDHALKSVHAKISPEEAKKRIIRDWGRGYVVQLRELLAENPELLDEAIKNYQQYRHSDKFRNAIKLMDGIKPLLQKLSKNYTIAVATGIRRSYLTEYLDRFDLHFFEYEFTLDDIAEEKDYKPAPYMLNELVKRFGVSKEETLYIGDAENDVTMAQAAGIEPIVVLTGHLSKEEAKKLGVKRIIPDATHLEKVLN